MWNRKQTMIKSAHNSTTCSHVCIIHSMLCRHSRPLDQLKSNCLMCLVWNGLQWSNTRSHATAVLQQLFHFTQGVTKHNWKQLLFLWGHKCSSPSLKSDRIDAGNKKTKWAQHKTPASKTTCFCSFNNLTKQNAPSKKTNNRISRVASINSATSTDTWH